jgi:hypothetical protein
MRVVSGDDAHGWRAVLGKRSTRFGLYAPSDFKWATVVSFGGRSQSNALTTSPDANRDR